MSEDEVRGGGRGFLGDLDNEKWIVGFLCAVKVPISLLIEQQQS